jgi:hypothetical protein
MRPLPLGDAPRLRPFAARTRALRLLAAAALAGAVAAAFGAGRHPHTTTLELLPSSSSGVVVLDLSASVSSDTYTEIGQTLAQLAASGGRYGLVVFSNTAYEALPPGSPARNLQPISRFFRSTSQGPGYGAAFPTNPWTQSFSAGTSISRGLDLGRQVLQRSASAHPSLLLISDLDDDPGDLRRLPVSAAAIKRAHIPVRIVSLDAASADQRLFRRLFAGDGTIRPAARPGTRTVEPHTAFPVALAALALAVALVLAASAALAPPLRLEEAA